MGKDKKTPKKTTVSVKDLALKDRAAVKGGLGQALRKEPGQDPQHNETLVRG